MSKNIAFELSHLSSKRTIVILLKWKYHFFTPLPDFHKPQDAALIGIFAEPIKPKLFEGYEKHFDHIFWFQPDYSKASNIYVDANCVDIPEVEDIIAQIIQILPKEKICLLETEEFIIEPICKIREKYGIPGPQSHELEYLRDKSILKQIAEEKNIPTMKFSIFESSKVSSIEDEISKITQRIPSFPIFYKPLSGCGSGGGGKIDDLLGLKQFISKKMEIKNKTHRYLLEECIKGDEITEFWVSCVLLADGQCVPYLNILCKRGMTNVDHLSTGYPMPFSGCSLDECEEEFPKLAEFAINVAKKLNPPFPHIFCVQGFQLKPNTSEYLLTEVGYRINGARGTPVSYYCAGVSQETALLSCHLDPNYYPKKDPKRPKFHRRYLWYPSTQGILKDYQGVPEDAPIKSKIGYTWLVPIGKELEGAKSFADFVVFLSIDNDDLKTVEADSLWIEKNWRPNIV